MKNKSAKQEKQEKVNLLQKLQTQYYNSAEIIYEYKSNGIMISQKKFLLIINKIKVIMELKMKSEYLQEQDTKYYLKQIYQQFKGGYQIDFIQKKLPGKNRQKIKDYIAILLHDKILFDTLQKIQKQLSFLYVDPNYFKSEQYKNELKNVLFLKNGKYQVIGEIISHYEQYCHARQSQEQEIKIQIKKKTQALEKVRRQFKVQITKALVVYLEKEIQDYNIALQKKALQEKNKIDQDQRRNRLTNTWNPQLSKPYMRRQEDTILYNKQQYNNLTPDNKHSKRSQILYQDFKEQFQTFSFDLQPQQSKNKSQCSNCHMKLGVGLYIIGHNQNYCHYTGKWYCNDCMFPNRMPIPWKALKDFDLKGYPVSTEAQIKIRSFYQKAILQIKNDSPLIEKNIKLYNFLYLKKQIHLMYDSICNNQFIHNILKTRINYCLRKNLLSLKNLYDIYHGQEEFYLQKIVKSLATHFYKCQLCQKKGYRCKICKKDIRIFTFQLKQTKGCQQCKKLYHKECFLTKPCNCSNN